MSIMDMPFCLGTGLSSWSECFLLADDTNVIVVLAGGVVVKMINTLPGLERM